jgi:hypothetical protein
MIKDLIQNWQLIVSLILGIYEVIARLIPTVKDYTIIGKLIVILKWISDYFNNIKKNG